MIVFGEFAKYFRLYLVLITTLLHSFQSSADEMAEHDYRRILVASPINLFPPEADDIHSFQILAQTGEGLVAFENHRVVPALAESWTISNDLKTYRFRLSPTAFFSDGTRVTANDVRNSLENILEKTSIVWSNLAAIEGAGTLHEGKSKHLSGLRILSPTEFELKLTKPYVPILETLSAPQMVILPSSSLKVLRSKKVATFISSGPYVLTSVTPQKLELEKNIHYRKASAVWYEKVVYDIVADRAQAVRGFNEGKYLDIWPHEFEAGEAKRPLQTIPSLAAFSWYIIPNIKREPFNHIEFRKFVLAHLDYEGFYKVAGLPPHYRAYGLIPRGLIGHRTTREIPENYSAELNLTKFCSVAKPCNFELIHAYDKQEALEVLFRPLEKYRDRLKFRIGRIERHRWYDKIINGKFQAVYLGNNATYPDASIFLQYLTKNLYHPGLDFKQIAKLLAQAIETSDRVVRGDIYAQIDDLLMSQVGIIPIYHGDVPSRQAHADIDGYNISLLGYNDLRIANLKPRKQSHKNR